MSHDASGPIRIALLGCGNVGGALARMLILDAPRIEDRSGIALELAGIAVRDLARPRPDGIPSTLFTLDAEDLVLQPHIDLVVELIGGIEPARTLVAAALMAGKSVVTGNKALLAEYGADLASLAGASGVDLLYEAAVAGAIPVIRPLRESLVGERITRVMGIVNGTTNFILTAMAEEGIDYDDALAEAGRLGLAESDPSADVEGHDAAAKAAVLAGLAFGSDVAGKDVPRDGITGIRVVDVAFAERLGYVVKLLAVAEHFDESHEISVRVYPAMVPRAHPLASVRGAFNAVFVEGEGCGELMFFGRGAGGDPSASAVLGDVIDAARNFRAGASAPAPRRHVIPIRLPADLKSAFYLCLDVVDRPAVLAAVAAVFGTHGVSIKAMEQVGLGDEARLIFLTHLAREGDVRATIADLRSLDVVEKVGSVLHVIGLDEDKRA